MREDGEDPVARTRAGGGPGEPAAGPGSARLRLVRDDPSEAALDEVADALRALPREAPLEMLRAVGQLVVDRLYGGDPTSRRNRGRKAASLRGLAVRLRSRAGMRTTALYYLLTSCEVLTRVGTNVHTCERLTRSHVRAVLPLPPERQAEVLARAAAESWSARRTEAEVLRLRPPAKRRAAPRFVREIDRLAVVITEDARFADVARAKELTEEEAQEICGTLMGVRMRCDDLMKQIAATRPAPAKPSPRRPKP